MFSAKIRFFHTWIFIRVQPRACTWRIPMTEAPYSLSFKKSARATGICAIYWIVVVYHSVSNKSCPCPIAPHAHVQVPCSNVSRVGPRPIIPPSHTGHNPVIFLMVRRSACKRPVNIPPKSVSHWSDVSLFPSCVCIYIVVETVPVLVTPPSCPASFSFLFFLSFTGLTLF